MNPILIGLGIVVLIELFSTKEKNTAQNLQNENESDSVVIIDKSIVINEPKPKPEEIPDDATNSDGDYGCYDLRQTDKKVCVVPFKPGQEPENQSTENMENN